MKIKNWHKFQHFKDRKPPWVKLYRDLLDDIEWHELEPKSAKVLVMLWLIASEEDGNIPEVKRLAFRLRMSEKDTEVCLSKLSHWVEQDDINTISDGHQSDPLETEVETETETKKRERPSRKTSLPSDWKIPEEYREYCAIKRPDLNPEVVAETFKNYYISKGEVMADWGACWRNFVNRQYATKVPVKTISSLVGY
jgi:hypothetical protein